MPEYRTVGGYASDEFTEKKSRFIGHIAHVETEDEALAFIAEIRSRYRDATHNVFAYSLRFNNTARASDDSEPQGTAGIPVLNVINGEGLTDVCIVVTRYFGGTLLGTGGLVRAYTEGAKIAVSAADKVIMAFSADAEIISDYDMYGKIEHYLSSENITVLSSDFTDKTCVRVRIRDEHIVPFEKDICDITGAKATFTILGKGWNPVSESSMS